MGDENHQNIETSKAEQIQNVQPFGIFEAQNSGFVDQQGRVAQFGQQSSSVLEAQSVIATQPKGANTPKLGSKIDDGQEVGPNSVHDRDLSEFDQINEILRGLLVYIQSHGGSVELVRVQDQIVYVKFSGTCVQCPLSFYTLTYGIERHIKAQLPHILRVETV